MMATISYAQCTIEGKSFVQPDEEQTYTISGFTAQCTDCHLWTTIGGNANIISDTKKKSIEIKTTSAGRQILSATILTPEGMVQCSKNISIGAASNMDSSTAHSPASNRENCDIATENYTEVKTSETTVNFYPNELNTNFQYQWKTVYFDGEIKNSTMPTPQFPFSKKKAIKSVQIKIISPKCIKQFTKSYDAQYWEFF